MLNNNGQPAVTVITTPTPTTTGEGRKWSSSLCEQTVSLEKKLSALLGSSGGGAGEGNNNTIGGSTQNHSHSPVNPVRRNSSSPLPSLGSLLISGGNNKSGGGGLCPPVAPRKVSSEAVVAHLQQHQQQQHFQMRVSIRDKNNNQQATYKHDGGRFAHSEVTLKLCTETEYVFGFKTKPPMKFLALELSGKELALTKGAETGEFFAKWSTRDIAPTPEGARDEVEIVLKGEGGLTLRNKLQVKFYGPGNADHARWGHKLDTFVWHCAQIGSPGGEQNGSLTKEVLIVDQQII